MISFLLDSKANPNFKDRWGGMALEDAIQNNHTVAAQLIFSKKGSLRQELAAGWLCDAASAGNILKLRPGVAFVCGVCVCDGHVKARQ